jgi:cytoskeletal protein CcmA (bactofilin family)
MSMFMRSAKAPDNSVAEIPLSEKAEGPAAKKTKRAQSSRRTTFFSLISAGLTVKGKLKSTGEIQIDGEVEGDVKGKAIVIGEGGVVKGSVLGDSVTVAGTVEGKVEGMTVNIQNTARLTGDIIHEALHIDSGAYVDGRCSPYNGKAEFKPAEDKAAAFTLEAVSEDKKKFEEALSEAG